MLLYKYILKYIAHQLKVNSHWPHSGFLEVPWFNSLFNIGHYPNHLAAPYILVY